MQEPSENEVRAFGVQARGLTERAAEFQSAAAVAARASFGSLKPARAVYVCGRKNGVDILKVVELGAVRVKEWLESQAKLPESIEKLWPETGQWETCWRQGKWV